MKNLQDLPINKIQRDESTQARVCTDDEVAGEYWRLIQAGEPLPEPIVFCDGKQYWLADGWHTVRAYELGRKKVVRCEIREGTRLDAIVYAAGANTKHGLHRTRADRRRAIWLLLTECSKWSSREIARHCCVDDSTVRVVKRELESAGAGIPQTIEVANQPQGNVELIDSLSPSQRATWESLSPEEQQQTLQESETDALDERLAASEVVIFRIEKRLGDDEVGKAIRNDLKLFRIHMRGAVGWEEAKRTVVDEAFRERTLTDLERLRKLNCDVPGARQRTAILDRLTAKVKEGS